MVVLSLSLVPLSFLMYFLTEVYLIYNVVLVSSVRQSDSVIHILVSAAATKSLQSCPTHCDPMDCSPPGSSVHEDSPGKNTGVGCHDLLQGIFQTQGLNPGLPHCQHILYHLSHQGSPESRTPWFSSHPRAFVLAAASVRDACPGIHMVCAFTFFKLLLSSPSTEVFWHLYEKQ